MRVLTLLAVGLALSCGARSRVGLVGDRDEPGGTSGTGPGAPGAGAGVGAIGGTSAGNDSGSGGGTNAGAGASGAGGFAGAAGMAGTAGMGRVCPEPPVAGRLQSLVFERSTMTLPGDASAEVVVTGDFTGDCVDDIVTSGLSGNSLHVIVSLSDGTFSLLSPFDTTQSSAGVPDLAAGDFDGDGHLDIATVGPRSTRIVVSLGAGAGRFSSNVVLENHPDEVYNIVASDLNRDSVMDLVHDGNAGIVLGDVNANFSQSDLYVGDSFQGYGLMAVGDFQEDGIPDVVINPRLAFLGNGNGTFELAGDPVANGDLTTRLVATDVNGDGYLDLIESSVEGMGVFFGDGTGAFRAATTLSGATVVGVHDMNLDGFPDLLLRLRDSYDIEIRLGTGTGTFVDSARIFVGTLTYEAHRQPTVGDFNRDGRPDIALPGGDQIDLIMNTSR